MVVLHFNPRIEVSKHFPDYDVYEGAAADLIAAGIIEDNMLPGRPGRNKTSVTIKDDDSLGKYGPGYIQIRMHKDYYQVRKGIGRAESARRRAEYQAAEEADTKIKKVATPAEQIQSQVSMALRLLNHSLETARTPISGYALADQYIQRIIDLKAQIEILEESLTVVRVRPKLSVVGGNTFSAQESENETRR